MRRHLIALLATSAIIATPMMASATVSTAFFPTSPSTTSTATISYNGTYAFPLPSPTAAPFAASPFSITATLPAQSYAASIGTGLIFTGITGSYVNNNVTTTYSGGTLDLKTEILETFSGGTMISAISGTVFNLTIPSLLATGDQYDLSMFANQFLYTEQDPLVSNPLPPQASVLEQNCSYCTPAVATIMPGNFTVLSGGYADYAPPLSSDPQASITTGGTGTVTSQLPVQVPEPGSLILLGGGIVIFGLVNWWYRRRANRNITLTLR
ncbi:PEP-CTERM sorting domain-containing protein [Acidiphilium sp.]|uniref:PEP-CTERM sorting domain-containing protein n=1 Tax=Acidiphilium sp. TaxID=527 RepID=UPI003D0105A1